VKRAEEGFKEGLKDLAAAGSQFAQMFKGRQTALANGAPMPNVSFFEKWMPDKVPQRTNVQMNYDKAMKEIEEEAAKKAARGADEAIPELPKKKPEGTGKVAEVSLKYDNAMPKREFERKANKLKELGERGLLYKAQNPVPRDPAVTRQYRQDMIKRIWKQYGQNNPAFGKKLIDRITKRMQPDHVWELQLGGPDIVENLKFLDSFTNWHIGVKQIRPQIKDLPTGTKIKINIEMGEGR
ncbi:hypothetical protein J7E85_15930, partial [Paenibacillus sp. ISL-20]|nr:hypothetical protein [Paenibacillus sp. ISL-20]